MTNACSGAIFDVARDLFGLTDDELEKILADPEQLLAITDVLAISES